MERSSIYSKKLIYVQMLLPNLKLLVPCTCVNFVNTWFTKKNLPTIILNHSMVEDKYQEETGQRIPMKYLRESCYHLKCFAANSLAALIRKWYLNSSFQSYNYYPKTSRKCWCDKNQHQQSDLHVDDRDERQDSIK